MTSKKSYNDEEPITVKCNYCDWIGNENQLILTEEDTELCPNCEKDGYIMDID